MPYTYNGVTYLIPPAPNSTSGTTSGVKFTVNTANASDAGVNIYPKGQSFSGNFALKFDMWINSLPAARWAAALPAPRNTPFSGLEFSRHRGKLGRRPARRPPMASGFGNDGDGGAARDYRAYVGNHSGIQTELIGASASGLSQSNHTASIFTRTLFPNPPSETMGTPGKTWAAMEIDQTNGNLIWKMNGTTIAQRANTSTFTSGDVMLGLMDVFPVHCQSGELIRTLYMTTCGWKI